MKFDLHIKDATIEDISAIGNILKNKTVLPEGNQIREDEDIEELVPTSNETVENFNDVEIVTDELSTEITSDVDLDQKDAKDRPWDSRIHASTKSITKNGCWKYKRGVDKDFIAQIESELDGNKPQEMFGNVAEVSQPSFGSVSQNITNEQPTPAETPPVQQFTQPTNCLRNGSPPPPEAKPSCVWRCIRATS